MAKVDLGQKFSEAIAQMEAIELRKKDIFIKPSEIKLTEKGEVIIGELGKVDFTKTGFQHFCGRLDIPSEYMIRLADTDTDKKTDEQIIEDLETFNINLRRGINRLKENKDLMFRTLKNAKNDSYRVRALFSDNYNVIDNLPILNEVGKFDVNRLETQSFLVTSDFMDLRFTMPDRKTSIGKLNEHEIRFGMSEDIVFPGLHIRNSETGRCKIEVDFIVYRLVCTNGLVSTRNEFQVVRKRHIGDYDISEITNKMAEVVKQADSLFDTYVYNMVDSKQQTVDDLNFVWDRLGKRVGVNKKMVEVVKTNWEVEQLSGKTRHDVISAITAGARDWEKKNKDYSGRLTLEGIAGDLLLSKTF